VTYQSNRKPHSSMLPIRKSGRFQKLLNTAKGHQLKYYDLDFKWLSFCIILFSI